MNDFAATFEVYLSEKDRNEGFSYREEWTVYDPAFELS